MMARIRSLRFFFIVLACSMFIFASQQAIYSLMLRVFHTTEGFKEGTKVANIAITGLLQEQAEDSIQKNIEKWKSSSALQLQYQDISVPVPSSLFIFDITDTMQSIKDGKQSPAQVTLDQAQFAAFLKQNLNSELIIGNLLMEELQKGLVEAAEQLASGKTFSLVQFMNQQQASRIVSQAAIEVSPVQQQGLQPWLAHYSTLTVAPSSKVSILQLVTEKNMEADNEALSVVASLIYKAILPTNFTVTQRSISRELPVYTRLGEEAHIEKEGSDFVFENRNELPYSLSFSLENNVLSLSIQGLPFVYSYAINTSDVTNISKRTIVQAVIPNQGKNDAVTPPTDGKDGYEVHVYREAYNDSGQLVKRELVANDYYLQVNGVRHFEIISQSQQTTSSQTGQQGTTTGTQTTTTGTQTTTAGTQTTTTEAQSTAATQNEQSK